MDTPSPSLGHGHSSPFPRSWHHWLGFRLFFCLWFSCVLTSLWRRPWIYSLPFLLKIFNLALKFLFFFLIFKYHFVSVSWIQYIALSPKASGAEIQSLCLSSECLCSFGFVVFSHWRIPMKDSHIVQSSFAICFYLNQLINSLRSPFAGSGSSSFLAVQGPWVTGLFTREPLGGRALFL